MTVYHEIEAERERAHRKHGDTSMEAAPADDPTGRRYRILVEEVGEIAREYNDAEHDGRPVDLGKVREELIQTAAMAAAWADAIAPTSLVEYQRSGGYPRRSISWSSVSAKSGDNLVSERTAAAITDFAQFDAEARGDHARQLASDLDRAIAEGRVTLEAPPDLLIVELGSNDLTSKDGEHWTRAETPLAEQVAARAQRITEAAHPDSSVAVGKPFVGPLDAHDWRCPSCGNDPADPTLHADGCPTIGTPAQHEPPADGSATYLDPGDIPSPLLLDQPTPDGA